MKNGVRSSMVLSSSGDVRLASWQILKSAASSALNHAREPFKKVLYPVHKAPSFLGLRQTIS